MESSDYESVQSPFCALMMNLFWVFGGGLLIAWAAVGYSIRDDTSLDSDDEEECLEYERSYYDEFQDLEERDHPEDYLKTLGDKWVHEDTPVGDIIMTYKADHESFWYYADRKDVPYKTLDAVARSFAIENDCKSVCVNYKEEFEKGKEAAIAAKKTAIAAKEAAEKKIQESRKKGTKSPFATFKSYNMKKGRANSKRYIITKNANRFTYKGPTSEWVDPSKEQEDPAMSGLKKVGYAAFKRGEHRYKTDSEVDEGTDSEADEEVDEGAVAEADEEEIDQVEAFWSGLKKNV